MISFICDKNVCIFNKKKCLGRNGWLHNQLFTSATRLNEDVVLEDTDEDNQNAAKTKRPRVSTYFNEI